MKWDNGRKKSKHFAGFILPPYILNIYKVYRFYCPVVNT